ncbi:hypothetical protein GCM10022288_26440 [Gryllotalpicola kribbensis]|uniref:EF-hand domain-containing protein n=1 Tax=Gryllotalpicola kribbensis TaxID=993084 RepID=A0ABP8AXT9_9MICO
MWVAPRTARIFVNLPIMSNQTWHDIDPDGTIREAEIQLVIAELTVLTDPDGIH